MKVYTRRASVPQRVPTLLHIRRSIMTIIRDRGFRLPVEAASWHIGPHSSLSHRSCRMVVWLTGWMVRELFVRVCRKTERERERLLYIALARLVGTG